MCERNFTNLNEADILIQYFSFDPNIVLIYKQGEVRLFLILIYLSFYSDISENTVYLSFLLLILGMNFELIKVS